MDISTLTSATTSTTTSTASTTTPTTAPSTTGSTTGDMLRITGLATGLNVDQLVSSMMLPYQSNIDKVQQNIQRVQWKQQMYQNIISDLKKFQSTYFDVTNPSMNINSPSFFNAMTATSSDTTNSIAVTTNANAVAGSYSVQVNSVAKNASISGNPLDTEFKVSDFTQWNSGTKTISFNVGSSPTSITIGAFTLVGTGNTSTDSATQNSTNINSLVSAINNQISNNSTLNGKVTASAVTDSTGTYVKFSTLNGAAVNITGSNISDVQTPITAAGGTLNVNTVSSSTTLSNLGYSGSGNFSFNYNGTSYSVSVSGTTTLGQFAASISQKTNGQVTASVDDITGKFTIKTTNTGTNSTLSITNPVSDNLMKSLGMSDGTSCTASSTTSQGTTVTGLSAQGTDANITITSPGGTTQTISESSNTFTINSMNYTINNITSSPVNITVSNNVDSVFTKFKGFMDSYNNIVNEIRTKVNENVSFDYPPLTSAQKSQMSATDIANWNVQAQIGLLHNDDNLSNMLMDLKNAFYDKLPSNISTIFSSKIGLDFSSDLTQDGTLVFSDGTGDAFKQALQNNGSNIISLFTTADSNYATDNATTRYNNEGIAQRINDILTNNVDSTGINNSTKCILGAMAYKQDDYSVYGTSGTNTFLDQIYQYQNQLTKLQDTYNTRRDQYYQQFTNLEQAMSQLNSQQSAIQQMASGG